MHLTECSFCVKNDRPLAFRRLGERHHIPALHASQWIAEDLSAVVDELGRGESVTLAYGPMDATAPEVVLRKDTHGTVSALVSWWPLGATNVEAAVVVLPRGAGQAERIAKAVANLVIEARRNPRLVSVGGIA